jgi:hypothetical protein
LLSLYYSSSLSAFPEMEWLGEWKLVAAAAAAVGFILEEEEEGATELVGHIAASWLPPFVHETAGVTKRVRIAQKIHPSHSASYYVMTCLINCLLR